MRRMPVQTRLVTGQHHVGIKMITDDEWKSFIKTLRVLNKTPEEAHDVETMKGLISGLYKKHRKEKRRSAHSKRVQQDREISESTIRCQRENDFSTNYLLDSNTEKSEFLKAKRCYVCKEHFKQVDKHYHMLCPDCSETNHFWRNKKTDLTGRHILVTGGRVKIGYHAVLRLLENGAKVTVTTRFPADAKERFSQEENSHTWINRLNILGLDLRDLNGIKSLIDYLLNKDEPLDGIINNAAQTVKRPDTYFRKLLEYEKNADPQFRSFLEDRHKLLSSSEIEHYFPSNTFDSEGLPADLRNFNSWMMKIEEVPFEELVEVWLINTIGPFLLNTQLKPLLLKTQHRNKVIVNVSAVEGQFNYANKTPRHPHTNMAKAALNMMTRTAALSYKDENIFMNSVDTGWITQENPHQLKTKIRSSGFVPPLDVHDGAARIIAPIFDGAEGKIYFGQFLKDYKSTEW
jgi:NAD(P)-dependent dehydrogenase (short-subunit alcohol dehydrogenase family)